MKKRVLVVDDSEMVRNFHTYILKMFGYDVITAENGAAALEKLLAEDFAIVITDINMPKMDGYELIKNIREQKMKVPVIIVSTEEEYKDRMKGFRVGANTYMVKPTEPEKLVSTVKILLEK